MSAKPPHGDCVDIDQDMNRMLNYYSERFSYSNYLCEKSMYEVWHQILFGGCSINNVVPCNPLNITKVYGKNIFDTQITTMEETNEFLQFRHCPLKCTEQRYDVKHNAEDYNHNLRFPPIGFNDKYNFLQHFVPIL